MDSAHLWLIAISISAFVVVINIVDRFSKRRIDTELKDFLTNRDKDFVNSLDRAADQAEMRTAAIITALKAIQDKVDDGKNITSKLYDLVMADSGWGIRLAEIEKGLRLVSNNKTMLENINLRIKELDEKIK
ncbi:MAG: hypothetical protein GY710_02190 [Desulfobacteraceae bacterium]|nr:hypothetical protein [Desulfobacteraceae bacterium]